MGLQMLGMKKQIKLLYQNDGVVNSSVACWSAQPQLLPKTAEFLSSYHTEIHTSQDFEHSKIDVIQTINDWIGEKTSGIFKRLNVDPVANTQSILVTVTRMKSEWMQPFRGVLARDTRQLNLSISNNIQHSDSVPPTAIKMLFQRNRIEVEKGDNYKIQTLPLKAPNYFLHLFRPQNNETAEALLREVYRRQQQECTPHLSLSLSSSFSSRSSRIKDVDIYIPKHCTTCTTRLEKFLLPSLGLSSDTVFDGFGQNAVVGEIYHNVMLRFVEDCSEIVAVTVIVLENASHSTQSKDEHYDRKQINDEDWAIKYENAFGFTIVHQPSQLLFAIGAVFRPEPCL